MNAAGPRENQRSRHPHDRPRALLIIDRAQPADARCRRVGRIEHIRVKREKRREDRILHIRQQHVGNHRPARIIEMPRPWLHNVPPEKQRGEEEVRVLDQMPPGGTQRHLVHPRRMPQHIAQHEEQQAHDRVQDESPQRLQRRPVHERPDTLADELPRQPTQHRKLRRSEQDQRRRDHGQQKMLHHVRNQQQRRKGIQRRRDGKNKASQGPQERTAAARADTAAARVAAACSSRAGR